MLFQLRSRRTATAAPADQVSLAPPSNEELGAWLTALTDTTPETGLAPAGHPYASAGAR
ncbi:hypothetical protein [Planomonospora sp. ID82291]|uniref:hypothetical protein n=1 Tax=Planomonospora sp. ID82291 TaxID=2738136 RepID=UPI0018C405C6|nr:hypothetical protein [Planomonospora sp. ID82291]MBG0819008.1 hypothetical protein [Planomonospora sp. ID82291]